MRDAVLVISPYLTPYISLNSDVVMMKCYYSIVQYPRVMINHVKHVICTIVQEKMSYMSMVKKFVPCATVPFLMDKKALNFYKKLFDSFKLYFD